MYFEEPKHDPVSSAFLTETQKNALVIIIIIIFKKEQKNKMYTHVVRVYDNTETDSIETACRDVYMRMLA